MLSWGYFLRSFFTHVAFKLFEMLRGSLNLLNGRIEAEITKSIWFYPNFRRNWEEQLLLFRVYLSAARLQFQWREGRLGCFCEHWQLLISGLIVKAGL